MSRAILDFSKETVWTISVIQTGAAIRSYESKGRPHANVNRFPLDGTEGQLYQFGWDTRKVQRPTKGKEPSPGIGGDNIPRAESSRGRNAHKRTLGAFWKLQNAHHTQRRGFSGIFPKWPSSRGPVDRNLHSAKSPIPGKFPVIPFSRLGYPRRCKPVFDNPVSQELTAEAL